MSREPRLLVDDWYSGEVPDNVALERDVYLDTSYSFASFLSRHRRAITLERACGAYDQASFVVGPEGKIHVGSFTCLNGVYLICHREIRIGRHCMFAWGSIVTDSWLGAQASVADRRHALQAAAIDPARWVPAVTAPEPVHIEDNVWVGFDSVILPGVRLGRGCVVGCKSVVDVDVPPYAVFVGYPGRIARFLNPDDSPGARQRALRELVQK
jgi:acetyltransferase-like isoleucine patch superfamily enzyme